MLGELPPGRALTLRGIAAEERVSMTPAREAVRRLVAEGALTLSASGRVSTPALSVERIEELAALRALTSTCTTSQLAARLGVSPGSASQHASILRESGLITTRRVRNCALYSVTPLGMALLGGRLRPVVGRVCMDQVVVDCGPRGGDEVAVGDRAVLFGPGDAGEPTAQDWADVLDTIHYEIVTRVGSRVPRSYTGGGA